MSPRRLSPPSNTFNYFEVTLETAGSRINPAHCSSRKRQSRAGTLAISGSRPYANHTAQLLRESAALLGSQTRSKPIVYAIRQKPQYCCNDSPPFRHIRVGPSRLDCRHDLICRDGDWGHPKQSVTSRHSGCDEPRLNLRHINRQTLLGTLMPKGPQIT